MLIFKQMNENKQLVLALIVCLFFCLIFAIMPYKFQGKGYDYYFHFEKAKGMEVTSDKKPTSNYPPLYHKIAGYFSFREKTFYLFSLFFLGLLTPLLLVLISKNWITALFYYCTTSYFYFFEQGVYSFALVVFMCLLVLWIKDFRIRTGLVLLGVLAHSHGFQLIGFFLFVVLLWETGILNRLLKFVSFVPACSGYFPTGTNRPDSFLDTDLLPSQIVSTSGTDSSRAIDFGKFSKLNIDIIPLPFLIMSLKGLFNKKHWHYLILFFAFMVAGVWHYRFWYVAAIISLFGLTSFYEELEGKWRFGFIVLVLVWGVFQFVVWFRYKWYCFPLGLIVL